jgi:hypothetical protein
MESEHSQNYYQTHKEEMDNRAKEWNKNHPERVNELAKNYRTTHKRERTIYNKNYYDTHREYFREYDKKYIWELKLKVLEKLGKKCSNINCPIPRDKLDLRCLQIDHIHGGGFKEKKLMMSQHRYYEKVLRDTEGKYQLLCAYCNWLKRYENDEVRKSPFT